MNITQNRLYNQRLLGEKFASAEDAVKHHGAVQSQDFPAAKWALGQRVKNATDESIEKAYNEGKILRTHIMRPTWHFVLPEDVFWIQKLTAPNVKRLMNTYNKKLELTDEVFRKTNRAIVNALKKQDLTRQELKSALKEVGEETDVQRLAHIVMWAELDSLIISGPKRGKQFTYTLFENKVKNPKSLGREESLVKIAEKYFTSHGPAQLRDFSWWSGLSKKDSVDAINFIKNTLHSEEINGKIYFLNGKSHLGDMGSDSSHLLSIFDEYIISYNDRTDMGKREDAEKLFAFGNALTAVLLLDGKIAGTWKRKLKKETVEISLNLFVKPSKKDKEKLEKEGQKYGNFLGLKPDILI